MCKIMPKVSTGYMQARREQILDAASNCFARKGFHLTSMKDICKEAELSPGAVYLHFSSKEDIIEASWKRAGEIRTTRFEELRQAETFLQSFSKVRTISPRGLQNPVQTKPGNYGYNSYRRLYGTLTSRGKYAENGRRRLSK
jgi:AcrR family transcriptional regulator